MIKEVDSYADDHNKHEVEMKNGHCKHNDCGHMMAFIHPDTFYTPFHWLSYQNDA